MATSIIDGLRYASSIHSVTNETIKNNLEKIGIKIDYLDAFLDEPEFLDAIVRELFNSWFVRFDPVLAKVQDNDSPKFTDDVLKLFPDRLCESDIGDIPCDWNIYPLNEVSDVRIGRTPPRKEPEWFTTPPDGKPWASIRDMGDTGVYIHKTAESLTKEALKKHNMRLVPKGGILFSFKLTVGRVNIVSEPMATNEAIAQMIPKNDLLGSTYLYYFLKNTRDLEGENTSSIATATNSTRVKEIPVLVPTPEIHTLFESTVQPIMDKLEQMTKRAELFANSGNRVVRQFMIAEDNLE